MDMSIKLVEGLQILVPWPWVIAQLIQPTFLGKSLLQYPELRLIILHRDSKYVLCMFIFLAQQLTWFPSIVGEYKIQHWLAIENLKKYMKIRQNAKYQLSKIIGCEMPIVYRSNLLTVNEHIHVVLNQSFRVLLNVWVTCLWEFWVTGSWYEDVMLFMFLSLNVKWENNKP